MRQSQLPLLGLLLAALLGSRINLPGGQSLGTSAAGESGKAGSAHQAAKIPARSSKPASTAVNAAPSNSALAQTICRLNSKYNQTQAINDGFPLQPSVPQPPFPDCLPHLSDQQPLHILSLMAAIEDPIHTHLGLSTDRTIDAIQAAAAVAFYYPYSHFLPWRPAEATSNGKETPNGESDLHQPGLLIFRKFPPEQPAEYLAVFLIPELPTTGLDQEAFFIAQKIMADATARTGYPTSDPYIVRFAGPNFSGSMASFGDIDRVLHNSDPQYSIHAFSGSITSPPDPSFGDTDSKRKLNPPSACTDSTPGPNLIDVCTNPALSTLTLAQTPDRDAINAFLSGVQEYGYCPEQIAILSEEGTEFGNKPGRDGQSPDENGANRSCQITAGPLFLHFPREISKLRNAYGAQAGQTPQSGKTTQSGSSQPDISVNWQDSEASEGDDIPAYGGQQTPLSQLAALSSLPGILRRQNIKALGILATDPMDEAFLIRSFKKTSRDVRLFLRDPDLLYLRALDAGSLNGTLLVSNYPLIPQNQFWSSGDDQKGGEKEDGQKYEQKNDIPNDMVTFPSALQEAQYNAFLVLLDDMGLPLGPPGRVEANWPAGSPRPTDPLLAARPFPRPLWLAVVGTAGHFPLKILPPALEENKLTLRSLDVGAPHSITIVLCVVFAMLGFLHVCGLSFPSSLPKLIAYDFYVIASTKTITASKALCHAAALSILAIVQLILGSSFVFFGEAASPYGWLKWLVVGVSSILMLVAFSVVFAIRVFYRKNRTELRGEGKLTKRPLYGSWVTVGIFLAIGIVWACYVFPASYRNAFMHVRDLSLVGGVAPCLPIAMMLLIAYLGCWAYLRRLTYWDYRKPKLPAEALDDVLPSNFNSEGGKMKGIDKCILELLQNWSWTGVFGLTLFLSFVAFRPWITLDMVEHQPIRAIAWFVFGLALFVIELNWFRFISIWSLLRDMLEDLGRLPIHAGFQRMPPEKSMPILRGGVSDTSFLPPAQSVDRIRALAHEDDSVVDSLRVAEVEAKLVLLGKVKDSKMRATCVWTSLAASWSKPKPEVVEELYPEVVEELYAVNAAPVRFTTFRLRKPPTIVSSTPNELVGLVLDTGESISGLVQELILFLRPEYWRRGSGSTKPKLADPPPPPLRKFILAEDLVALRYYNYIRYVVNELRNLLFFVAIASSMLFLAFHIYAFRADDAIDWSFLLFFVIFGGGVILVLYQMEVDPILSHLGGSKSGEVGWTFYLDLLKYGAVPALTIIGAHVPMVSNFLLSWLQPTLESMH